MNNNLQSEQTAEQQTGLVLAKACDKAVLCHLSYSVYTESIMREVEEEQSNSEYDELSVGGTKITELRYADDTALFSTTPEGLNYLVQAVNKHGDAYKLSINAAKTKIMELDKWQENTNIVIDNINVERVQSFQYLGAMFTTNGDGASNIKQRLAMAVQALAIPVEKCQ